jgi:hypothetical protein
MMTAAERHCEFTGDPAPDAAQSADGADRGVCDHKPDMAVW